MEKEEKLFVKEKTFIKEVIKEVDSSTASASKDAFFQQAGLALAVYCKNQEHQNDMSFLSMMTSPDKKEILNMKKDVMLSKMRAEKRRFDDIDNDLIPTTVEVVDTNNTTISSSRASVYDEDDN
jgi:tRNA G37 N-methylase TrmD